MMTFSARSYNQRFTVLNTHQCLTTVQMRYHSYAREGFGDAVMAKCGHKNAQTPYQKPSLLLAKMGYGVCHKSPKFSF